MQSKLAVIGAGPGGLHAAIEAARLGMSVCVYEKGKVGDGIQCGEGFFDLLKLLGPPSDGICFKVEEILFTAIDTFRLDCSRLNIWMIDRVRWQKDLARQATALGCRIFENNPVSPDEYGQFSKRFDWVVDATGVWPVSRKFLRLPAVRVAHTAQLSLTGDFSALYGKMKVVAEQDYCGYYWIFPKSSHQANVGVGWFGKRKDGLVIRNELRRILIKEGLADCKVLKAGGGPIPVECRKTLASGNSFLVGDAAGLASPLHGGGIDTASISGILAARAAHRGNTEIYTDSVRNVLDARLKLEKKILGVWEKMDLTALNRMMRQGLAVPETGTSFLAKCKQVYAREAAIISYVLSGKIRGDWEKGILFEDIPLVARLLLKM